MENFDTAIATSQTPTNPPLDECDADYWFSLIDENEAGKFVDQSPRTMQDKRQTGEGPKYIRLSARCIKYRRIDLKQWVDERIRKSTSDPGPENEETK